MQSFLVSEFDSSTVQSYLPAYIYHLYRNNKFDLAFMQWRNTPWAGGRVPPDTSDREISADLPGKKGNGVKIEKKPNKIVKGKVEN